MTVTDPSLHLNRIEHYLKDPLLRYMYDEIRAVGPLRSIQVDITHKCNIRCKGCYFFAEKLDQYKAPEDEADFDAFIEREKARGTNYMTVVGGEPSLMLDRLKKIYDNFWMVVVTNGIRKIPYEGFENLAIAISVWGDHQTDTELRGNGKIDVFARGLKNYKDDSRAGWYYTTTPGNAHEIESVVEQIVANGNNVNFNFYSDLAHLGGDVDHHQGFGAVVEEIERMTERYPERIFMPIYVARTVASGELFGDKWGFDVCCTLSGDKAKNQRRFENGKATNTHFRAYSPDLKTTRSCCRSDKYDCENCFETWAHIAWIMANLEKHLGSEADFTNWLSTMFTFYMTNRVGDFEGSLKRLPEVHQRLAYWHRQELLVAQAPMYSRTEVEELVNEAI